MHCAIRFGRHGRFVALAALATSLAAAGGLGSSPSGAAQIARGQAPARSSTSHSAGAVAAGWLGRQFKSDGDLPETEGEAGVSYVPLAIVALASARVGEQQITKGIGYLERHFTSYVEVPQSKTKSVPAPGRLAGVILAAVAAKVNPARFGGDKSVNDLVARLLQTETTSGPNKGLFGSPNAPTYSSAYTQGLVLTALAASGEPSVLGAKWLAGQQCSDGGWESYRSSSTACPAPDPKTYAGPDTNDTALAIEGLAATKVSPKVSPLSFLEGSQYTGGGFGYYGGRSSAQSPDPDSTALVAQGLVTLGKLSAVKRGGKDAEDGLAAFRLGCSSPTSQRGAYEYPGEKGPNLYATIQAIPGAMGAAYPVSPGTASKSLPRMSCS